MKLDGIPPGIVAFVSVCKACSCIGCPQKGLEFPSAATIAGLETNPVVACSVVDMYAKVGSLVEAQGVFETLQERVVVPWTALITGYVEHGRSGEALLYFEQMQLEGITSDPTVYLAFSSEYGVVPTLEHYNCIIDLLRRTGHIEEAVRMVKKKQSRNNVSLDHNSLFLGMLLVGKTIKPEPDTLR